MGRKKRKYVVKDLDGFIFGDDTVPIYRGRIEAGSLVDMQRVTKTLNKPGGGICELVPVDDEGRRLDYRILRNKLR